MTQNIETKNASNKTLQGLQKKKLKIVGFKMWRKNQKKKRNDGMGRNWKKTKNKRSCFKLVDVQKTKNNECLDPKLMGGI